MDLLHILKYFGGLALIYQSKVTGTKIEVDPVSLFDQDSYRFQCIMTFIPTFRVLYIRTRPLDYSTVSTPWFYCSLPLPLFLILATAVPSPCL